MILRVLYTLSPLIVEGVLHMVMVQRGWLAALARPLDGGRSLGGARILGDHKTWRGVVVILGLTIAATGLQRALQSVFPALAEFNLVDLDRLGWALTGLVWGTGYALAELPNSFFKRRLGIAPGGGPAGAAGIFFAGLDQADSAIGCALAGWWFLELGAGAALAMALVGTLVHLIINALLFLAGQRDRPL